MTANAGALSAPRLAACLLAASIPAPAWAGPTPERGGGAATGTTIIDVATADVAITEVAIVDVEHGRATGPRTVLIGADRIVAISAPGEARIPAGMVRVDGRGKFLIPGLVDAHVHLFNLASHRPPAEWSLPLYVAQGVTAVREMSTDADGIETIRRWRREADRGERIAPRILAAGIAVSGHSPEEAAHDAEAAIDAGADFVKVFSEVPAAHWQAILEVARRRSKPVAGHVPAGVTLRAAAAAGQRSDEHLMQAYEACSSIEQPLIDERRGLGGKALAALRDAQEARALDAFDPHACARTGQTLAKTGQVQVPTLVIPHMEAGRPRAAPDVDPRWRYLRADERVRWRRGLADLDAKADAQAEKRWLVSRRIVSALHDAGVAILAGTDAPMPYIYPGFALHEELALLVESGLTPSEALNAATLAPARFFGLDATTGSVDVGKAADLVLLDADPLLDIRNTRRIDAVLLGERLLRRADLDALLESIADANRERRD